MLATSGAIRVAPTLQLGHEMTDRIAPGHVDANDWRGTSIFPAPAKPPATTRPPAAPKHAAMDSCKSQTVSCEHAAQPSWRGYTCLRCALILITQFPQGA